MIGVLRGQHTTFACGNDLPRVKGKAGDVAVRTPDPLPLPVLRFEFGTDGAGGILDDWQTVHAGDRQDLAEIARHSHLMNAQDRPFCGA
jgi:hypothetical protein